MKQPQPIQPRFYGTGAAKQSGNNGSGSPRGNKTLAWFMNDQLFEKEKKMSSGSSSPLAKTAPAALEVQQQQKMVGNGAIGVQKVNVVSGEEKKRRRGARRGKKQEYPATPSEGSAPSEDIGDEKQKIVNDFKDDYWYYDVATDGYYYEQNGAKGWRRRMPAGWVAKQKSVEESASSLANSSVPPSTVPSKSPTGAPAGMNPVVAAQMIQNALFTQPAYKYYDKNSDGYFYEMASVDGWRKRQPARPAVPPRASQSQSYGATLARGQLPANCIVSDSSASSSASDDAAMQDLLLSALDDLNFESLARPSKLTNGSELLTGFNPDKFLEGFSFNEQKQFLDMTRTPLTPVKNGCAPTPHGTLETPKGYPQTNGASASAGLWNGWYGLSGQQGHAAPAVDEDTHGMSHSLMQDLQKIWQTPAPTGVN